MRRTMMAVFATLLALPAAAGAPSLEATGGDVKALLVDLKKSATADSTPLAVKDAKGIYQETDCQGVTFAEGAGPVSESVTLMTKTWIEECRWIPTPPGGGVCIPERRLGWWDKADVRVEIAQRGQAAPAEKFRVCMTGRWLSLNVKESPFKYDVKEKDGVFTLTRKK